MHHLPLLHSPCTRATVKAPQPTRTRLQTTIRATMVMDGLLRYLTSLRWKQALENQVMWRHTCSHSKIERRAARAYSSYAVSLPTWFPTTLFVPLPSVALFVSPMGGIHLLVVQALFAAPDSYM